MRQSAPSDANRVKPSSVTQTLGFVSENCSAFSLIGQLDKEACHWVKGSRHFKGSQCFQSAGSSSILG